MSHPVDSIELGGIVTVRDQLLELQSQGKEIFRLESGDPSFDPPDYVKLAINKALSEGQTHYTTGAGIKPLREAAAKKLITQNQIPTSFEQVLITNGAMHALYIAFRAICEPGDQVIIPDPTWTETADNITLAGGIPIRAPLGLGVKHGYAKQIEERITNSTQAIVINSPHNPTGTVLSKEELQTLVEVAEQNNLWIISDEAYEHIVYPGVEHVSPGSLGYDKVISIYSFSKSYAMSGLRLGYVVVPDDEIRTRMSKLLRCTINGVNSATQWGGIAALESSLDHTNEMVREYSKRRDILFDALHSSSLFYAVKPEGAFYIWAWFGWGWTGYKGERDSWAMTKFLASLGIGSAPGIVFGPAGHSYVRFAFSCSTDQIEKAANIIKQL